MYFKNSVKIGDEILRKSKKIANCESLEEAVIRTTWIAKYAEHAQRWDRSRLFRLIRHPYEPGIPVQALSGEFFDHRECALRMGMLTLSSLTAVTEYESNYINAAGYCSSFHQSAMQLRPESLRAKRVTKAVQFDFWANIAIRYSLRVRTCDTRGIL